MCELFVLETGVDILSRARVRVTYCALLRLSAHAMPRVLALRAICSLSRRENAKTLAALRVPAELSRSSLIFTPRGCLTGHGNVCSSSDYKTKSPHRCVSFLFWKPASTRRDPRFSLSVPLCGATVGLRAVAPFRNRKMLAVRSLRVPSELYTRSLIFLLRFSSVVSA